MRNFEVIAAGALVATIAFLAIFGRLFDQQSESVEGFADDAIFASQVRHLLG